MPYEHLQDGFYLVRQQAATKGVDHYGILDVGNRLRHPHVGFGMQPVVIHQTPPRIRIDWLQATGQWTVLGHITDEVHAINRIELASRNPTYSLVGHNCEHFARFVATGKRESTQVQVAVLVAGLAALAYVNR